MTELLIGCGRARDKRLYLPESGKDWKNLVTLDHNPDVKPDVVWDLEKLPLPFEDSFFDELHAYEVLEHLGRQGDWRTFFAQFEEFHRILKPNGLLCATVPHWQSVWAWGDPSHTRVINEGTITFLSQKTYEEAKDTCMTDFRHWYNKADFEILSADKHDETFAFVLKAIKK